MPPPEAIVFDAYGTLFDVHSVVRAAGRDIAGDLPALSALWRRKQLQYTWLRSLMGCYEDFWRVTGDALRAAVQSLGLAVEEAQIARLMEAYLTPAVFPDVPPALAALGGVPLAILSNGSPRMLASAVAAAGLGPRLAHVLSVDAVRIYKPASAVYALGPAALGIDAARILFVSSNAWDVAGARAFGYRACWCNRSREPMEVLGFAPDLVVSALDALPARL